MRFKFVFGISFLIVSSVSIWFYHQDEAGKDVLDDSLTVLAPIPEKPAFLVPLSNPIAAIDSPEVLWSVVNNQSEMPEIPFYQGDIEDAVPLQIDHNALLKLKIGQTIIVGVPQQKFKLEAVVQTIKNKIKGIKTIVAATPDNSVNLLVTIGKTSTFANLSTPRGSYEFVGTTSHGWLMPSANMDQNVDYSKPDYVIEKIREPISYSKDGG